MNRRLFLMASGALLAGCATATTTPVPPPTAQRPAPPSTPPPPVPPPPPEGMSGFLTGPDPVLTPTGDGPFDVHVQRVLVEGGSGWRPYLLRVLEGVRPDPRILAEYDAERANWIVSVPAYIDALVTEDRIRAGRQAIRSVPALTRIARERQLPVEVLAALWGAESDYGRFLPRYDAVTATMTLGAYDKGRPWWQFDIYRLTELIASGRMDRRRDLAYHDASLGQVRWYPETILRFAADGDGDGRKDVWRSPDDIVASLANTLGAWTPGEGWIQEVVPPSFDPGDPMQARQWRGGTFFMRQLRRADGKPWRPEELDRMGRLLTLDSAPGRAFIASRNYEPLAYAGDRAPNHDEQEIEAWGIAVGLLAHRIREG